ncbi:TetR/AcrR family transcriptional regulator [Streptococcus sp. sy010]|uniref:TetR/AcrR family transcriptional regulator n=1 Tax=Streptococcus sp. sy010 TaxID=2600148 RepID=UPI0011B79A35|nr:TetR/AcrR family transcriptional regulator [Streptococcus sp. sy010]TWT14494.1 TetR/AcrR family transcriptional regulator [Streptococcus sp. sy010]
MNNQDLRVIKTKKNIIDSFIVLLNEKPFSKITIQDILDRALINRATFYRHYLDKYDLAQQLNQQLIEQIKQLLDARYHQTSNKINLFETVNQQLNIFAQHRTLFLALLTIQTEEINLKQDLLTTIEKDYYKTISSQNQSHQALKAKLFASIILTVLIDMVETQQILTLEEIKLLMENLLDDFKQK